MEVVIQRYAYLSRLSRQVQDFEIFGTLHADFRYVGCVPSSLPE
jgi:hypothetical protein